MEPDLKHLEPVLELARRAGEAIMEVYRQGGHASGVEWKADKTPVTRADRAAHQVLTAGLEELVSRLPVISEEGWVDHLEGDGPAAPAADVGDPPVDTYWMVDPLDGTKEFLKRTGEFTVNVALIKGARPVAGVVHAPALSRSWLGARDGAIRVDASGRKRLQVRTADPSALGVVASRDHAGPGVQALLDSLPGADTLSMGSSLKFCLIAEGRADLYLRDGPTMEWDTAAAQAVLEASGGGVFTLNGQRLAYGKPHLRNPHFVAAGDPGLEWRTLILEAGSSG